MIVKKSIFGFKSYKNYLKQALGLDGKRTGLRKKAAKYVGVQTTYLSQVLNGKMNLNMEQAYRFNDFLGHDQHEKDYFMLLVQHERAGTVELKNFLNNKIQDLISKRVTLKERIQTQKNLSENDQSIYYSKWYYACIHVLVSIPEFQTKKAIVDYLKLPLTVVVDALEFLETAGLIVFSNGSYKIGPSHIHLSNESAQIAKHHFNWRNRALVSLDAPKKSDLHYSVVWTLSKEDAEKIKLELTDYIQSMMKTVRDSKEQCAFGFTLDYFEI
jgi:uncharacterized protein (TIGR02147 family)